MLRTNEGRLVKWSVQGKVHHPLGGNYRITQEGVPMILPSTGGISYNVSVGDPAFGWIGDHVEPGVSIRNENASENDALMTFACIGNVAKVVSGDAKGRLGYVTGSHGGIEHTLVHFDADILEDLCIDDSILIKAYGQGLKLLDYPDVHVMNLDPILLQKLKIQEVNGKLQVPVSAIIPPYLMGSGIGANSAYSGDYDIMTGDLDEVRRLGLHHLRFGDLVLLKDCDTTYGRGYLKGAMTLGIIVHSDCVKAGHGPGVTTIMSCKSSIFEPIVDHSANIAKYMKQL